MAECIVLKGAPAGRGLESGGHDYLMVMERSPVKDTEIKHVLRAALTDKIHDREVYMKGIDMSYFYEGYIVYKTSDLQKENKIHE